MRSSELLADTFGRVREVVVDVLDGIEPDELTARLDGEANTIAWLVWHLTRVQDDHVAAVAGVEQTWTAGGWSARCALPLKDEDIGYGHDVEQMTAVVVDADLLRGYYEAVHSATERFLATLSDADLDRVVDERWDPQVTLGVRLISVIADDLQHAGQAAYVKGLLQRR